MAYTHIVIDGTRWSVADFRASKGLHVSGSLYLSGTRITAL